MINGKLNIELFSEFVFREFFEGGKINASILGHKLNTPFYSSNNYSYGRNLPFLVLGKYKRKECRYNFPT